MMGLKYTSFRKLLKMHEAKYDPMEKADAEAIMEEILGMQCGLNPDQQVRGYITKISQIRVS